MLFFVFLFALINSIRASLISVIIHLDKLSVFTYTIKVWETGDRHYNFYD